MKNRAQVIQMAVLVLLFIFATAFSLLVGEDQRNFLVIFCSLLSLPLLFFLRLKLGYDLIWIFLVFLPPFFVTLIQGSLEDFSTIGYTGLFAFAYLFVVEGLRSGYISRESIAKLLKLIIQLYALFSVLQMAASLAGLPEPNLILSKGLWSYNSLAVEPSHAGRALAITMLVFLIISREPTDTKSFAFLFIKNRTVLIAFLISISLTGSSTALVAAILAIILALSKKWMFVLVSILMLLWPTLYMVDLSSLQRSIDFLSVLPTMDASALIEADQSGAMRILPFIIFLEKADFLDIDVWFGGGLSAIAGYVQGELIGAGDLVAAGFTPGYIIAFGLLATLLFLWVFLLRFVTKSTLPVAMLWIVIFITSPWNSQLFWYGLMLMRVIYYFEYSQKKREKNRASVSKNMSIAYQ